MVSPTSPPPFVQSALLEQLAALRMRFIGEASVQAPDGVRRQGAFFAHDEQAPPRARCSGTATAVVFEGLGVSFADASLLLGRQGYSRHYNLGRCQLFLRPGVGIKGVYSHEVNPSRRIVTQTVLTLVLGAEDPQVLGWSV